MLDSRGRSIAEKGFIYRGFRTLLDSGMVPCSGTELNSESPLLAEWKRNSKGNPATLDGLADGVDIEQLFDTLAEWNDYLENYVPYFSEGDKPQEPGL